MSSASFLRVVLIASVYGFLKEFKPTEPYLYEFEHVTLNISGPVLSAEVYPIWTYAYLAFLIPVFLLTDLLLYKPVVVLEAVAYLTTWIIFDFGKSVLSQQFIEGIYGCATATEVAYYAYLYVAVEKDSYRKVTSLSRSALLAGRFCSYLISQLIILLGWGDYMMLNYITTGSLVLAVACSLALPMISWRDAYERRFPPENDEKSVGEPSYSLFAGRLLKTLWRDTKQIYSDSFTLKWSLWWALASCVDYQVQNYTQTLWGSVQTAQTQYNGITEAIVPFLSIPCVLLMQKVTLNWRVWGEPTLSFLSLVDAGILLLLALTPSIFVMYGGYIAYRVLYEAMITIAQFNLASRLAKDSFGLLFGLNTFIALGLQTILTLIVNDKKGLHLPIRTQFFVYSGLHVFITIVFAVAGIATFLLTARRSNRMVDQATSPVHSSLGGDSEKTLNSHEGIDRHF